MRALFQLQRASWIGLDIQDDAIRLLQLCSGRKRHTIVSYGKTTLLPGVVVEGKVRQADALRYAIHEVAKEKRMLGSRLAFALPLAAVITKRIPCAAVNDLDDMACEAALRSNLPHYFPGMTEALCFDFAKLAPSATDQELLLVASREAPLLQLTAVIRQAGLRPLVADVEAFALLRAILRCGAG